MSMAVVLVAAAALLGWWWPRWMVRIQQRIDARWVLVAWAAAQAMFAALWVAAVSVLMMPNHFGVYELSAVVSCLRVLSHGAPAQVETVAGVAVLGSTVAAAVWVGALVTRAAVATRRAREHYLQSLRLVGQRSDRFPDVWWLSDQRPMAFCLPGRNAGIAATTGLQDVLTDAELNAVIAHERAHRRQRHHAIVLLAGVLGRALPFIPLFARGARGVATLVEQAADARAAEQVGTRTVCSALGTLARSAGPSDFPARALPISDSASVTPRLHRLYDGQRCVSRGHHAKAAATVAGVVVLPTVIAATSAVSALVAVACLL